MTATATATESASLMSTAIAKMPPRPLLYRSRAWLSFLVIAPVGMMTIFSAPAIQWADALEIILPTLGWGLFCTGALLRWWATLYIGGRKDRNELICEGPYSVVRHPLYLGTVMIGMSTAFFLESIVFATALVLTAVFYLWITLPREEQLLMGYYGDSYQAYMHRVPRLWPRWSVYRSPAAVTVNLDGLRAEFIRSLRWMWTPLLAHMLAHFRLQDWWPHWGAIW